MAGLPDWPRCLSRDQAAAYVGVSPGKFDQEVADGIWPSGETRGGRILWDRVLLDKWQDERSGLVQQSMPAAGAGTSEWAKWS
ncbi:hypothetical protein [Azospirillum baldaniorum]|uniref:Helix-turn-helix domain-containing protein n=2 Tax=Azospirillum baldaniorum TaxID=1064539 RepID=A0A9P1NKY4_9PROT|nr:hypothetical protein [Azospirillum baldaniorum]CCC96863.1 protein of unknown function [Azospirillum baldaniorum]